MTDHFFGSQSTDLKLQIIERYLCEFTKALRPQFRELWYIDAFAGTGSRAIKHGALPADLWREEIAERIEQRRGSARIALEIDPCFDKLMFVEKKKKHYDALVALQAEHPDREIIVKRGDANEKILELIDRKSWAGVRAVIFLDPYGMALDWSTLEAIRNTRAIDVWYLVSLEGLFRQAARDRAKLTDYKRAKICQMVGCADWEDEWYPAADRFDLVDLMSGSNAPAEGSRRRAGIGEMEAFFQRRLTSLFPKVAAPIRLKNKGGVETFSLFFAASNPEPRAYGLAIRIANHILNAGRVSQTCAR